MLKLQGNRMKARVIFRSVSYSYFIVLISILLFWVTLKTGIPAILSNYDFVTVISFIAIGFFSVLFLVRAVLQAGISLCVIHWYFIFIFFFIVPFFQYLGNLFTYQVNSNDLLTGNIFILLWCLVYAFSYDYSIKKTSESSEIMNLFSCRNIRPKFLKHKFYILTLVSTLIALHLISIFSLESFFTRGSYSKLIEHIGGWKPHTYIITFYLRPLLFCTLILFIGTVFFFRKIKRTPAVYVCLFVLFAANIIVNNPLSYARFMSFTMLFGLFILFSFRRVKTSLIYISVLFLGLPFIQTLNIFRQSYYHISQNNNFKFNWDFLFRGSFDAYENFIHTIRYVNQFGIVYGKQLAGALLFFVPRSFWINKPVGSGTYIAHALEKRFDVSHFNIGNPLISEMYLNFHITGIVIGALFYGFITSWLDKNYRLSREENVFEQSLHDKRISFYNILYPFLLGLYLFHLRGDFISSYAYTVGFILAFVTAVVFLKLRII
jgi:hypothetical protein